MYVTAHRVRSGTAQGINSFLHLHGEPFSWPDEAWRLPDDAPGKLVLKSAPVPPGGNHIQSYLDVLAADGTPWQQQASALEHLEATLHHQPNPVVFQQGSVTIRFGVLPELEPYRKAEFDALCAHARKLVQHWEAHEREARHP